VVDISQFGIAIEINPRTASAKMVPALRFINWKEAEQYFRAEEAALKPSSGLTLSYPRTAPP
jgi:hypothetical protein